MNAMNKIVRVVELCQDFSDTPKSLYIDSDSDVSLSEMRNTVPPNFMPYHQSDYEMKTACNISYIMLH